MRSSAARRPARLRVSGGARAGARGEGRKEGGGSEWKEGRCGGSVFFQNTQPKEWCFFCSPDFREGLGLGV